MESGPAIARAQAVEAGRRSRTVRHARLVPACEDDAAQMRFAVEDALNTADFGDGGRLVLVRRLRLADLPPRASPTLVARAMEQAWWGLAVHAVAALHPSAARAEAVFFASRLEARMAWLAKAAAGEARGEWFWPAALPELKAMAPASHGAAVERVLEAALREGGAAVVNQLERWHDAPLVALVRALPARAHRKLLQVLAASQPSAGPGPTAARVPAASLAAQALQAPLARVARRLAAWAPLEEAPASLLAALWLQPVLRRSPSLREVSAVTSQAIGFASQPLRRPDREQHAREPLARAGALHTPTVSRPAEKESHAAPHPEADVPPRAIAAPRMPEAATARPLAKFEPAPVRRMRPAGIAPLRALQSEWPWLADAAFTRFGGLMLVLNVLGALRFQPWIERTEVRDAQAFVRALLVHCLDRAGARDDDPQRAWLEPSPAPLHSIRLWTVRLRRSLRRHARMDLAELVRRPAYVSATPTHVDVLFSMDDVDMRLRRLGLDADPGWVPWFGRIVQYHFMDAQVLPPPTEDLRG